MLVTGNWVRYAPELLHPDDFFRRSHATIYQTILEMYGGGENVDTITLTNALSNRGLLDEVGGKAVVHTLAATVPAGANAPPHAPICRRPPTYPGRVPGGAELPRPRSPPS